MDRADLDQHSFLVHRYVQSRRVHLYHRDVVVHHHWSVVEPGLHLHGGRHFDGRQWSGVGCFTTGANAFTAIRIVAQLVDRGHQHHERQRLRSR